MPLLNPSDTQARLLLALTRIAPGIDAAAIAPGLPLRCQAALDAADWLNFLIEVDHLLGVDIPFVETDEHDTLADLVRYCLARGSRPPLGAWPPGSIGWSG